jgi:hypothetical protein
MASAAPSQIHSGVFLMAQREKKKRTTKREWYNRGGFANSKLFRKQSRGGAWRYYIALDHDEGK